MKHADPPSSFTGLVPKGEIHDRRGDDTTFWNAKEKSSCKQPCSPFDGRYTCYYRSEKAHDSRKEPLAGELLHQQVRRQ